MQHDGYIDLIEPEASGGKISRARLDLLQDVEGDKVRISGLRQDTLEYFVHAYGQRFKAIELWKCPQVADLSPLEDLHQVQSISLFWNQKADRLWRVAKNKELIELSLQDVNHANDLAPLADAPTLQRLSFGNEIWSKHHVLSLAPLLNLPTLTHLDINPKAIEDNSARPLTKIPRLQALDFSSRLFTTEKVAWLKARLPHNIESPHLAPFVRIDAGLKEDIMVIGKRKPFLNAEKDAVRLGNYVEKFNTLVAFYRAHPEADEPS